MPWRSPCPDVSGARRPPGTRATGASACPTGSCNGNTYPQVYDAVGRYMFIGLKADF